MTHDELLAKITPTDWRDGIPQRDAALRAVVELHKPEHSIAGYRCTHCTLEITYPCPTIQTIEKELA
jgi:hypothetical protein